MATGTSIHTHSTSRFPVPTCSFTTTRLCIVMAPAMIYGYVPTIEWLLAHARIKNLAQYDPKDVHSMMNAVKVALKDIVYEIRLKGPSTRTIRVVTLKDRARFAIVLRNNWGQEGATDKQIAQLKGILRTDLEPRWFPLLSQDRY